MALVRKAAPRDPALDNTDYTNLVVLQATDLLQANGPHNYIDLVNDLVLEGAVFNVGGTIYLADDDTAISGTPSPYVAIIPSGATASAAYVADLTSVGVSWDGAYNGWYDGSGNLYIFDESAALAAGEISELHQKSPLMTPDGGVAYRGLGDVGKLILLKSYVFDEAGTDTISVPAGSITVEAIMLSGGGGGGGGEDAISGSTAGKGGGGGAAGNFRAVRVPCFGLSTISYVVGAGGVKGNAVGGSSGANGANGSPGGDTSITVDSITYAAPGGLGGGGGGIGGTVGVGGAAGSYAEADIDIAVINGKAGQNGFTNNGTAAGGAGGIGGALLNSGAAGGGAEVSTTAISLGMYINYAGGAGGGYSANGSPGEIGCGGGGGGGGYGSGGPNDGGNGGNGGSGRLIIKFYGIPQ